MRLFFVVVAIVIFGFGLPAATPPPSASGTIAAVARVEYPAGLTPVRQEKAGLKPAIPLVDGAVDSDEAYSIHRFLFRLPASGDVAITISRDDALDIVHASRFHEQFPSPIIPGPSEKTLYFDLPTDSTVSDVIITVIYLDN